MITKRFDFNYRPLQINISMVESGGVPAWQNYDMDTDEYTPDYTITPLVIQPKIGCIDKDDIIPSGSVNAYLCNVKWFQTMNGVRTEITTTNSSYEIAGDGSGDITGRIIMKYNLLPQIPVTLEFHAQYVDPRTNQIHTIVRTTLVRCSNATKAIPHLTLDAADQTIYNPLIDADKQTVSASLTLGTKECPAVKREFVWEVQRVDGSWSVPGSDMLDYDVEVSADGSQCTVDRSLMGKELSLRCRAKYDPNGNPNGVALTEASPQAVVSFVRRIPKYEYDISELPTNIPPGLMEIAPTATIWDTNGSIDNANQCLIILWYMATNKSVGKLDYKQLAHGRSPIIPTALMSLEHGGVLGLDVIDAGPLGIAMGVDEATGDDIIFEDGDGNLLLIK